jgi:Transposase IS4
VAEVWQSWNSQWRDPTESKMRRSISPAVPRRSPRRLDAPLPLAELHATLTPVVEGNEDGGIAAVNLFGTDENLEFPATVGAADAEAGTTAVPTPSQPEPPQERPEAPPAAAPAVAAAAATPELSKKHAQPMGSPEIRTLDNFSSREAKFTDGYDTDGDLIIPKEPEDFDEEPLVPSPLDPDLEPTTKQSNKPIFVFLSAAAIDKLTIAMLKHELMIRAVPCSSNLKKNDLKERLTLAIQNKVQVTVFGDLDSKKKKGGKRESITDMTGFAPGAHWQPLIHDPVQVEEPTNTIVRARAPTVPRDESYTVPQKFSFKETFDRPLFKGRHFIPKVDSSGQRVPGQMDIVIRQKLVARKKFQELHHLSRHSDPVEFADAFIPWNSNVHGDKLLSMSMLTTFTNLKASLANAGNTGNCYPEWTPFSVKEVRQFLGVQIWHGLSPSPRVEMKFKSSFEEPVQGNNFLHLHLGANATRRYKMFRAFLSCQDPRAFPPSKKTHPLFKVSPVIKWINEVGPLSVDLGKSISIDEQTVGFQGRHSDKLRISYKAEGDGFQCDVIAQEGFTYACYFRNEPPPHHYTSKGISPLHARCLWLFDKLKDKAGWIIYISLQSLPSYAMSTQ